jgi:hypothetical protein
LGALRWRCVETRFESFVDRVPEPERVGLPREGAVVLKLEPPPPQPHCRATRTLREPLVAVAELVAYDIADPSRAAEVVQLPVTHIDEEFSLTALSKKALEDAGVLMTWQGMAAVKLAELIDTNRHGRSGAANNVKAHREAMAVALQNAKRGADVISRIFAARD